MPHRRVRPASRHAGGPVRNGDSDDPQEPQRKSLMDVPWKWIHRAAQRRSLDKLILDLNSSASETSGRRKRLNSPARKGGAFEGQVQ